MYVVIFSGDRNWGDTQRVRSTLEDLQRDHGLDLVVVQGGASGLDSIAGALCDEMGIDQVVFPANWKGRLRVIDGKNVYYAGPFRNQLMLDMSEANEVFCFHDRIQWSKGTKHMRDIATKAGVPVTVVSSRV